MKSSDKEFIAEAEEILEEAGRLLLIVQDTYPKGTDPDSINALFRALHTLKGLSGLFGLQSVTDLSHALESLLDDVRLGKIAISDDVIGFLFKNLDLLRGIVENLDNERDVDVSGHINEVHAFRKSLEGVDEVRSLNGVIEDGLLKTLSEYEEHRLKTNIGAGKGIYVVTTVFGMLDFDKPLEELTALIKSLGELISTLPTSTDIPSDSIGFNLMFGSAETLDELKGKVGYEINVLVEPEGAIEVQAFGEGEGDEAIVEPDSGKTTGADTSPATRESSLKTATTTVRVDIEKLDRILNTIGELSLVKGGIKRISNEMSETYGRSSLVVDMFKISKNLNRKLSELQEQVLEVRMVPIGQIFGRLSQVIRRYSREVGKKIDLTMFGEETEIDKFIAEGVIDPLVHVVRNAIDHGIEPKDERIGKGKRKDGTVILKAYQRGNYVVIDVSDDGRGIDIEKIRKKAIDKGLIEEGASLSKREIIEFIFLPGFSTRDTVSEVSGRGVGLDIVREHLSSIGGFSDVLTEKDEGTTITLTIPITLAIIKSLLVRVGSERFAVPLTSISETHAIEHAEIKTIEGREVYSLRGEMIPAARLNSIFDIKSDDKGRSFSVVIGFGERKIGLLIDELLGQHEVVVKSLGDYFKEHKGFAGAAEIGRHEVILVLDVESVIEGSLTRQKGAMNV